MKTKASVLIALLATAEVVSSQATGPDMGSNNQAPSWQHYMTDYSRYYSQYYNGGSGGSSSNFGSYGVPSQWSYQGGAGGSTQPTWTGSQSWTGQSAGQKDWSSQSWSGPSQYSWSGAGQQSTASQASQPWNQPSEGKSWQDFRKQYGTLPGTGTGPNPGAGKDARQYYSDSWKAGDKSSIREEMEAYYKHKDEQAAKKQQQASETTAKPVEVPTSKPAEVPTSKPTEVPTSQTIPNSPQSNSTVSTATTAALDTAKAQIAEKQKQLDQAAEKLSKAQATIKELSEFQSLGKVTVHFDSKNKKVTVSSQEKDKLGNPLFSWEMDTQTGHIAQFSRSEDGEEETLTESDVEIKSFSPSAATDDI